MADSQDTRIESENPSSPLAAAIARHKAAYWAYRARADFDPDIADAPYKALMAATDELKLTPCANDAELFEKVRYLFEFECQFTCRPAGLLDGFADVVYALDLHLNGPASSAMAAA
jgi:hypothetical protein